MGEQNGRRQPAAIPDLATALEQALALHQAGRLAEAERLYRAILDDQPGNAEALHLLGVAALQQGRADEAAELIGKAAKRRKKDPQIQNNLGEAYRALGRLDDAAKCYRRAISLDRSDPAPHNNLGNVLASQGKAAEAAASYRRALDLAPDDAEVMVNLGAALRDAGEIMEAADVLGRAVALRPGDADVHANLGTVLAAAGDLAGAIESYRKAVALVPDDATHHTNLGNVLQETQQFADAIACHRRALAIDPEHAAAHHNLGEALLLAGDFEAGWKERDWRWRVEDMERERPFPQAVWQGEPLKGKAILVTAEQGVGDEVLFAGMVPDLIEANARVVLECDKRLVPIYERSFEGVTCVAKARPPDAATQSPDIDYRSAGGSLGRWLRPDRASFPGRESYLVADDNKRDALRAKYEGGGKNLLVGIAWISKNPRFGRQKSMTLAEMAPLAKIPGVALVDLQYGDTAKERKAFEKATGAALIHDDAVDQMASLDDFAAQIAALDLVVSVSNTTVHMAGALGVATWVMPHVVPLSVWMRSGDASPWYPSVRLYRQTRAGEWADVVARVAAALEPLAGGA